MSAPGANWTICKPVAPELQCTPLTRLRIGLMLEMHGPVVEPFLTVFLGGNRMSRIRLAFVVALMAAVVALAAPGTSHASGIYASQNPSFKGWGLVDARCFACPSVLVPVYRWDSSQRRWTSGTRRNGTQVYVYPYSGNWRWTWTSQRGWLAMQADYLVVAGYDYR